MNNRIKKYGIPVLVLYFLLFLEELFYICRAVIKLA